MLMLRKSAEILKCTNTVNAEMCTDVRGAGRAKVQQVRAQVQRAQQISESKHNQKACVRAFTLELRCQFVRSLRWREAGLSYEYIFPPGVP